MRRAVKEVSGTARASHAPRQWRQSSLSALVAAAGWILLWPLTRLIPRNPNLVVFFGRDGGRFLDNCKHLFVRATERRDLGIDPVFFATDSTLRSRLECAGGRSLVASQPLAFWRWLRAGTIVVDNVDWLRGVRFAASRGAQVVQLWHGIPLKKVQLGRVAERNSRKSWWERALFEMFLMLVGRRARVDWMLSTSQFVTEHAFQGSFLFRRISNAGYPRNDVLLGEGTALSEVGVDPVARRAIGEHRARSQQAPVVLFAPTFREALDDPFASGRIDLGELATAMHGLGILLLIKLHPIMQGRVRIPDQRLGVVFVAPDSDAYPLLRDVDVLVTDYSSIFFDYLLLDRPVVFFCHDLATYLADERSMYFDYAEMTPGPKVTTVEELAAALALIAAGGDSWRAERERVRSLVFEHTNGRAADRLLDELFSSARNGSSRA